MKQVNLFFESDKDKEIVMGAIHDALVGSPRYVNNDVILNVDNPCMGELSIYYPEDSTGENVSINVRVSNVESSNTSENVKKSSTFTNGESENVSKAKFDPIRRLAARGTPAEREFK